MKNTVPKTAAAFLAFLLLFTSYTVAENGDNDIVEIETILELRSQEPDGETVYKLTGEAVLTFQQAFRNQKYIEDGTAGILIDDRINGLFDPGIITTEYEIYDGIIGITGTLSEFGNMIQLVPVEDPGDPNSHNNVIEPLVITMDDFVNNFMEYQSRLVTIENVYFVDPEGVFQGGQVHAFTDGDIEADYRVTFYDADYVGDPIPVGEINITGLPNSRSEGDFMTARHWDDIESLTEFDVTFEIMDEANNPLDNVTLEFRGETITEAPYFFPAVPAGTHPYTASKEGYHTTTGSVTVTDEDLTHAVILVEIDPDMITEFPMLETFDDEFPPSGWSHYALGDAGGWELDDGQALHNPAANADSWLVTPQIHLPEDESMLLTFMERNQLMTEYGYSGVKISRGSGNPVHEHFTELYESDDNIGIADPEEAMIDLGGYAGEVVYLAFNYHGDDAHRWWVNDVMIDFVPEAIEVPDIATLRQQPIGDLAYRITGEVVITHLQQAYRGQFFIQDQTGAILVDDPGGVIETDYNLYDGVRELTGTLSLFANMLQLRPTEDPGAAYSTDNVIEPVEMTLGDLTPDHQGQLVIVRNVHFDEDNPETFIHNTGYDIYDDTAEATLYIPNDENSVDYIGEPVPETPKDLISVVQQFGNDMQILPRMLDDFMDPEPINVLSPEPSEFSLFPNPASTHFTLVSADRQMERIRIYNLNGQLVKEKDAASARRLHMDVTRLNTGMYILEIISGNDVKSLKLQINR